MAGGDGHCVYRFYDAGSLKMSDHLPVCRWKFGVDNWLSMTSSTGIFSATGYTCFLVKSASPADDSISIT